MLGRYPSRWLMTDERLGDALPLVLRRLPPGSGVVVRHYSLGDGERRRLIRRVARVAGARRLVLLVAGDGIRAAPAPAGVYGQARRAGPRGYAAHDRREAVLGARAGAAWLFVSPVHATRSHPGRMPLRAAALAGIATATGTRAIALGGMDERRWRRRAARLRQLGFDGWAGIDAWI